MRYACLIYFDPRRVFDRSPEGEAVLRDVGPHDAGLEASGRLVAGHALQLPESAMTVRVRDGKMSATDGPFLETREMLGGIIVVEARTRRRRRCTSRSPPAANHVPRERPVDPQVSIPGGTFRMGSPAAEPGRYPDEGPVTVEVAPFRIDRHVDAERDGLRDRRDSIGVTWAATAPTARHPAVRRGPSRGCGEERPVDARRRAA